MFPLALYSIKPSDATLGKLVAVQNKRVPVRRFTAGIAQDIMRDGMGQPTIETERLLLRPFSVEDANDIRLLAGKKKVSDTTLNIPYPYADGMAESWIATHPINWDNRTGVFYAITIKDSKELIGAVSLSKIDGAGAELAYWVGIPFWRMGYCTAAASALIEFASGTIGIANVRAVHLTNNPASGRVLQKLGMRQVSVGGADMFFRTMCGSFGTVSADSHTAPAPGAVLADIEEP